MSKKTVIYFDKNPARLLMMEIVFKGQQDIDFLTYQDFEVDSYRLKDYEPELLILDADYAYKASYPIWIFGRDLQIPFNPLKLKNQIKDFLFQ